MSIFHDEVEIEDMEYDEETDTYRYPCPCGDKFEITLVRDHILQYNLSVDVTEYMTPGTIGPTGPMVNLTLTETSKDGTQT